MDRKNGVLAIACVLAAMVIGLFNASAAEKINTAPKVLTAREIPAQLPDPDNEPPAANKAVKVYILSGQSGTEFSQPAPSPW